MRGPTTPWLPRWADASQERLKTSVWLAKDMFDRRTGRRRQLAQAGFCVPRVVFADGLACLVISFPLLPTDMLLPWRRALCAALLYSVTRKRESALLSFVAMLFGCFRGAGRTREV